jgi:hypothetical protein
MSKTTKYEDWLHNFCPSAHYLAHTEFEVTGGCSTCLLVILSMSCCLWILTLILTLTKLRDMKLYPVFFLLPSFSTNFTTKFTTSLFFCRLSEEERRWDIDSCLAVLSTLTLNSLCARLCAYGHTVSGINRWIASIVKSAQIDDNHLPRGNSVKT